jgi:hypothetical protein
MDVKKAAEIINKNIVDLVLEKSRNIKKAAAEDEEEVKVDIEEENIGAGKGPGRDRRPDIDEEPEESDMPDEVCDVVDALTDAISDISDNLEIPVEEAIDIVEEVITDEEAKEELAEGAEEKLAVKKAMKRKVKASIKKLGAPVRKKTGKQYIVVEYEGGKPVWISEPISDFKEACRLADRIYERDYDKYVDPEIGNEEYWFRVLVFDADDEHLEDFLYASHEPNEG